MARGCNTKKVDVMHKRCGSSGYKLYCADAKSRIEYTLKTENGGKKISRAVLQCEMSKRWEQLPESTRNMWNQQAVG
tara:strand:- start:59 stop:289 length:231 start_codon:yes stop_codon:yes gene_type:complete